MHYVASINQSLSWEYHHQLHCQRPLLLTESERASGHVRRGLASTQDEVTILAKQQNSPKLASNIDLTVVDICKFLLESYQGSVIIITRSSQVRISHLSNFGSSGMCVIVLTPCQIHREWSIDTQTTYSISIYWKLKVAGN